MTTVGEHAVPAAVLAAAGDWESGVGVVCDDAGPVAVVDTDGRAHEPVLLVAPGLTLAELADSALLTLLDAYPELPGFVVCETDGTVRGVLPVEVLDTYLGSGQYAPAPSVMGPGGEAGDVDVPGDPRLPRARIRCRAAGCGYVNTLAYLDPAHPPECGNPRLATHPLAIREAP
ncbi:MAG: hypothetical protein ACRDT4_22950 [Micromonosporaceae bacterium]